MMAFFFDLNEVGVLQEVGLNASMSEKMWGCSKGDRETS